MLPTLTTYRLRTAVPRLATVMLVTALLGGCGKPAQPSFLLVVLDTTRADAVSAYGRVSGTTPFLDRLAASGIRYARAYANANWTLPSHATIFTGLLPSQHGVRQIFDLLPADVPTLGEYLKPLGYERVGVSENPWMDAANGWQRDLHWAVAPERAGSLPFVRKWLATRDRTKPFFLFVNIFDPHLLYTVRETNYFVPAGVTAEEARAVDQNPIPEMCVGRRTDRELEIMRGLYLGDVLAADAKLGALLQLVRAQMDDRPLITIVTADHGEYLGESGLIAHEIGIGQPVTHVPLIVQGLPGLRPAVVETPVQLADILPSILAWAGAPVPAGLTGRLLPLSDTPAPAPRTIIAEHQDLGRHPRVPEQMRDRERTRRMACIESRRIFGDWRAVIRFPYELIWYAGDDRQLFDIRADPAEQQDILAAHPEVVAELTGDLERLVRAPASHGRPSNAAVDPELVERLQALGYLGGADPGR